MNQEGLLRMRARREVRRGKGRPEILLAAVFKAFRREAARLGIALGSELPARTSRLRQVDPVSGDETLVCDWCNEWGQPAGSLVVNPDGSFYAEQALSGPARVMHALRAWGRGAEDVHAEARRVECNEYR